jgi:hypothetical protein
MSRFKLPFVLVCSCFVPFWAASCGKAKDSGDSSKLAGGLGALNFQSLKISKGLNIKFPEGVKSLGKSPSAFSLAPDAVGKKSLEACRTAQQVHEVFSLFSLIGRTFCHLEAEWARLEFGKKYNVILTEGESADQQFSVWVDNSEAGKLVVYQCFSNKLEHKVTVHSATDAGVKGNMVMKFSESKDNENSDIGVNLDFDATNEGTQNIKAQVSVDSGESSSYREAIDILLRTSGVSQFSSASKGVNGGKEFALRGLLKHSGDQGQALLRAKMYDEEWGDVNYSSRSTFDSTGVLVDNSAAAIAVKVDAAELPAYVPSTMTVEKPTGWDCQADETVNIKLLTGPTSAAHQACLFDSQDVNFDDCFGSEYASGEEEEVDE